MHPWIRPGAWPDAPDWGLQAARRDAEGKTPEEILGQGGALRGLTKRLVERALEGEVTTHLGYTKHAGEGRGIGNSRNGTTGKSILTGEGELDMEVPRDRKGDFDPHVVRKGQRRLPGFDEKVIALYPLDAVHPMLYLDAMHLNLRSSGSLQNQGLGRFS